MSLEIKEVNLEVMYGTILAKAASPAFSASWSKINYGLILQREIFKRRKFSSAKTFGISLRLSRFRIIHN